MDEIQEEKLTLYRRIEALISSHEKNEANAAAAVAATRQNRTSIGPANDLLRFMYILQQQYQDDSDDVRSKARQDLSEYMEQFRSDVVDEEEEEEEEQTDEDQDVQQSKQSVDFHQSTPTAPSNPPAPPPVPQSISVMPTHSQPLPVVLTASQPAPILPTRTSSSSVTTAPSTQASSNTSTDIGQSITDRAYITPYTLERYEQLVEQAKQYTDRIRDVDSTREKQLLGPIRSALNKLRPDTLSMLTRDIFDYLSGKEQRLGTLTFRISNNEERLLCLSNLADSILRQLLGGDLNDVKTATLLPFIKTLTGHERSKEFRTIFIDYLHKKCPYTVPLYPKRLDGMTDDEYRKAMGYEEKKDGSEIRLETEDEFLNRMSGLIRLFCKLATNGIPPFDQGLLFGWEWCSNVLNLPPQPNLTPLLLRVFFQEAGQMMMKAYPQDFPKLLRTIKKNYLAICEGTSPSEKIRLQTELEKLA